MLLRHDSYDLKMKSIGVTIGIDTYSRTFSFLKRRKVLRYIHIIFQIRYTLISLQNIAVYLKLPIFATRKYRRMSIYKSRMPIRERRHAYLAERGHSHAIFMEDNKTKNSIVSISIRLISDMFVYFRLILSARLTCANCLFVESIYYKRVDTHSSMYKYLLHYELTLHV